MTDKISLWIPKRYVIVMMVFFGYIHYLCLHTNIGMAVVEMTSPKKISLENGTVIELIPEFGWTSQQKALVLSSFAYGRLLGPIGGTLAGRFGGSTIYGIGIWGNALITLLTPFFLRINFYLFVVTTALTGTFESFSYSSAVLLWSRWTPTEERAKSISVSVIGTYAGSIVSFVIAGWILSHWGWQALFYASGAEFFIWFCLWTLVVKNDPADDKRMCENEREYIKDKLNNSDQTETLVYPWKDILTCLPFWACCCCKFCIGGGYTITIMNLPQYIKDTSDLSIETIGYISMIPQAFSVISMPIVGFVSDYIRSNKLLSVTNGHKLNVSIGLLSGTVAFLVAGLWSNFMATIVSMCFFHFLSTCVVLDMHILVLDLGPRYSAFMHSVAYTFYTVASFLTPVFIAFFVTSHEQSQWNTCFLIASVVFLAVTLIFLKFGSGELQPWANFTSNKLNQNSIKKKGAV